MPYTRTDAKKLLSTAEIGLFDASRRDALGALDARALKSKIERTRRLRDKYLDLYQRQRLATRERTGAKPGRSGVANLRTREKATLLADVLTRFEARLAQVAGAGQRAPQKEKPARGRTRSAVAKKSSRTPAKAAGVAKGPRRTVSPKAPAQGPIAADTAIGGIGRTGFMSSRAKGVETNRQLHRSRGKAIQAHIGSVGRRNQAKRDRRS